MWCFHSNHILMLIKCVFLHLTREHYNKNTILIKLALANYAQESCTCKLKQTLIVNVK